ncbi:MAG: hypothetical protein E3J87_05150 [Candidatus Cloacimonadota bacterium]|nr:MAG: hypothetical protein E3J87_05150 [Candidatus Cloacimonadota bacterium]
MKKLFLFLSLILFSTSLFSQEWRYIHPYKGVNIYSKISFTYDDNIFKYSKEEIDKFVNNIEPYRYPIETYDDLITTIQLHSKIRREILKGNPTTFNIKIKGNLFYENSEKDYETFSFSIWQKIGKKGHTLIKYFFLPKYFIRYYPDFDIDTPYGYPYFTGCYFMKHLIKIEGGYKIFGSSNISLSLSEEINDYNTSFNEYDTEKKSLGISIGFPLKEFLKANFSYSFARATAEGVDEPGEEKNTSDDSDISNDEDKINLSLVFDLTKHSPLMFQTGFEFTRRVYTTDKPILCDPSHSGREDKKTNIRLVCSFVPTERLTFQVGYIFEIKDVFSPYNIEQIEEIKNYRRNRYLANITFSY